MSLRITILICIFGLIGCKDKKGETDLILGIEEKFKNLKPAGQTKFGGGDVWGIRHVYANNDSSVVKIVVDYDAGDYGKGQNEFLLVDSKLVYQRDYVLDWLVVKSPLDTNNYKLREAVSYYSADSTGLKKSKTVYTRSLEVTEAKKEEFKNRMVETDTLTKNDYVTQYDELKKALQLELIED